MLLFTFFFSVVAEFCYAVVMFVGDVGGWEINGVVGGRNGIPSLCFCFYDYENRIGSMAWYEMKSNAEYGVNK